MCDKYGKKSQIKVLIFGASGNLGSRLVSKFEIEYEVGLAVRDPSKLKNDHKKHIVFKVDLDEADQIKQAIESFKPKILINASYITFANNIVKEASQYKSIEHIILTGSTGIFTEFKSSSAELKRLAESKLASTDLPITILRPTMIYGHRNDGNFSRLVNAFKRVPIFPVIGDGGADIQPIFIDDLVDCFFNVSLKQIHYKKSYNLGGEKAVTNLELFKIVRRVFNQRVLLVFIPEAIVMIIIRVLVSVGVKVISVEQVLRFTEDKGLAENAAFDLLQRAPLSVESECKRMKKGLL